MSLTEDAKTWKTLLVDDITDNLMVAATILEFYGAEVKTARNGIEALDILETFEANLILLDLSMPEMNGWELFDRLQSNEKYLHTIIIAVTAHAYKTDKDRVMESGFSGYISKPYDATTFVDQILQIVSE